MEKYRRWKNSQVLGIPVYATTTVLDHIHAFDSDHLRDLAASILLSDCKRYGAALYAYVVMINHVHAVVRAPDSKTQSWLFQRLKSNSAKLLLPHLGEEVRTKLRPFQGLNRRSLWKEGFRGFPLEREETVWQKVDYTHNNPVRAGLVDNAGKYRWSSASFVAQGLCDHERGLDCDAILAFYGVDPRLLQVDQLPTETSDLERP